MKKPRILFISHSFPPIVGGVETQNYELFSWLSKLADIDLLANKKRWLLPFFLIYAPLKALLFIKRYDILLLGSSILGNTSWLIKLLTRKPVVMIAHGLDLTWDNKFYQSLWVKNFIPSADKLIAVGNETIRIGTQHGIAREKFIFIPNGVDTEKNLTTGSREKIEKIIGKSIENKTVILTSGRLAKRKGVAWFIKNVMPELSNVIYIVAGDGPDKQNIVDSIAQSNQKENVVILGYVSDEIRNILFNSADIFVQPNIKVQGDMEGFGISVIEAAACRLPVVAAKLEGLQDAIKDKQNGFLVESQDSNAYVKVISETLADPSYRKEFGEKARQYVTENYQWQKIAQRYLEEIQKIINKN